MEPISEIIRRLDHAPRCAWNAPYPNEGPCNCRLNELIRFLELLREPSEKAVAAGALHLKGDAAPHCAAYLVFRAMIAQAEEESR